MARSRELVSPARQRPRPAGATTPHAGHQCARSSATTPTNPSAYCTVDTSRAHCRSSSPAPSRPTYAQQEGEHVLGNPSEHVRNPSVRAKQYAATDEKDEKQTKSLWRELAPMSTMPPRRQFLACVTITLLGVAHGVVNSLSHRRATAHLAEAKTALQNHQKLAALTALDSADEEIALQSRFSLCHLWHCQSKTLILLTASLLRAQALETPPVNLDAALSEIERALTLLKGLQADDDSEEAARQLALMEGRIHHRRGNWSRAVMAFGRVKPRLLQAEHAHLRLLCESQLEAINGSVTPRSKVVDEWLGTRLERVACGDGPCGAHRAKETDSTSAVWCAEAKLQECRLQSARKELRAARQLDPSSTAAEEISRRLKAANRSWATASALYNSGDPAGAAHMFRALACVPARIFIARTHLARSSLSQAKQELEEAARIETTRVAEISTVRDEAMKDISELTSAVDSLILQNKGLTESSCETTLENTSKVLFGNHANAKLSFEQVPFQKCSLTASYGACARMQAERLLAQDPDALTDMIRVNTVILRAEAYEVCGYVPQSGIVFGLLSSGDRQSQLLLEAVANLSAGAAHPARETLRDRALFFKERSLVMAARKRIADCQIDQALQAIISSAFSRGGKPRAATLAVYQAAIAAKRCTHEHGVIEHLCVEVISSGIDDADVYEMLSDALHALGRTYEALKALRQAYELIAEWQVLSSWRVFLKIKILETLDPSRRDGGGGDGAFDGGSGKAADSSECSEQVMDGDDYTLLGVNRFSCSRKRLKSAFRKAALKYHPDKYTGTKECAEMHFRQLSNAHDRLLSVCT